MHLGPGAILLAITVDYRDSLSIEAVETATERLYDRVRAVNPRFTRIFVRSSRSRRAQMSGRT
jgi:hypothetical protein